MPETLRLLCVDDEANILNVLKRQLFASDMEIHTALSAREGLELLRSLPPVHIILSDERMPGMGGTEFLREARRIRPDAVRIMLSGFADAARVRQSLEDNHLHLFLRKPWRAEELHQALTQARKLLADGRKHPSLKGDS